MSTNSYSLLLTKDIIRLHKDILRSSLQFLMLIYISISWPQSNELKVSFKNSLRYTPPDYSLPYVIIISLSQLKIGTTCQLFL